ncbi:hypothetical protein Q8F55_008520 [Vanrija albida]|uniref:F-box domain-containing protein n=1 Tax=Vanrija albida TaxID=181172 RepID=A0ABR3PR34_9TREE
MNTSLATDLRRKHFRQISIMGTRAGVSALRAIASNRFVSRHVVEVRINTAIVGDMTSANPTFHDQLALLELDALDTGIKVKKVGPRVYPVAPNPRPSQPLALLLGEALARLPNLARVSTHYWNPRPVGENATAPPSSSVGLCALRGKGGFICGGQGNRPYAAALFWGIVLALAHAHTPRTKMGYPPIRALQCRSGGVTLASFPKAMVHQALLAPALAGLEGLNVMVLPGTDPAAERVAFTAFLNLASNLRELSLHGMWTTSHTGVLGCLAGPKAAVLPCLERLELFTHETTTEVMFRLLSTTRVPWVRLSQVHLRWVTGEGNVRFPSYGERESAWSSLLTAVSEYHKAAGTTSAVKTLELNDVHQWRNGQFERVPFHRGRSKKHHRAHHCFIIGTGDRTNFGRNAPWAKLRMPRVNPHRAVGCLAESPNYSDGNKGTSPRHSSRRMLASRGRNLKALLGLKILRRIKALPRLEMFPSPKMLARHKPLSSPKLLEGGTTEAKVGTIKTAMAHEDRAAESLIANKDIEAAPLIPREAGASEPEAELAPSPFADLPADILVALVDHLGLSAQLALRLTCAAVNGAIADRLRQEHFRFVSILSTLEGAASLYDIARHSKLAPCVQTLNINTAVMMSIHERGYAGPQLDEQIAFLELPSKGTCMQMRDAVARRCPDLPTPEQGKPPLVCLLTTAIARLPKLKTVGSMFWRPSPISKNDYDLPDLPTSSLGLRALHEQHGEITDDEDPVQSDEVFWNLVLGLAHAHSARTEAGYPPVRGLTCAGFGVGISSFLTRMPHFELMAPALAELEMLNIVINADTHSADAINALAAFLRMVPNITELYYRGPPDWHQKGRLCSLTLTNPPVFPRLRGLEVHKQETTTDDLFHILTTTRATYVRLHQINLLWEEGAVPFQRDPWRSLLAAVSEHHKAAGTTSTVMSLELSCIGEWGNERSEEVLISITDRAPKSFLDDAFFNIEDKSGNTIALAKHCCFAIEGVEESGHFGQVRRLHEGEDTFRCALDDLRTMEDLEGLSTLRNRTSGRVAQFLSRRGRKEPAPVLLQSQDRAGRAQGLTGEPDKDVLDIIIDALTTMEARALRDTCSTMNNVVARHVRRRCFSHIYVLCTPGGFTSLWDLASDPCVAPYVVTLHINTAVVGDSTQRNPVFYEQLGMLEVDPLDAGFFAHETSDYALIPAVHQDFQNQRHRPARRYPEESNPRPDLPLARVLGEVFARLPKLCRLQAVGWNPRPPEGVINEWKPDFSLGARRLYAQKGAIAGVQTSSYTGAMFWAVVFGLVHAHQARTEAGYVPVTDFVFPSWSVSLRSFAVAMKHKDVLAPVIADLSSLSICLEPSGVDAAEVDAFAEFLRLAPRLHLLSLRCDNHMWERQLLCLVGPTAPALAHLVELELCDHSTTTEVLFHILTNTHVVYVRLWKIHLTWVEGVVPLIGTAWKSLFTAVSEHHKQAGTKTSVRIFEVVDLTEGVHGHMTTRFYITCPRPDDLCNRIINVLKHTNDGSSITATQLCAFITHDSGPRATLGEEKVLDKGVDVFEGAAGDLLDSKTYPCIARYERGEYKASYHFDVAQ